MSLGRARHAACRITMLHAAAILGLAVPAAAQEKPAVLVIATGGTISNTGNDSTRRTGQELVSAIPQLADVARVTSEQFSNVASGAITLAQWRDLARRIRQLASGPDAPAGIVITHGTDTMEETAYFLDLTVGGCAPIVLTGAMRRAVDAGADGPANLLNAVRVAAAPHARGRGAMILMNDLVFAARDVTKLNTSRADAFGAPYLGPIGVADPDTVVFHRPPAASGCRPAAFDLDRLGPLPRVDVIQSYVGADSVLVDALVAAGAKGIVVAGVGRGGMTPGQSRALRRALERGVFVAVSSRTGSGRVGRETNLDDWKPGRGVFVGASDLNPQKARILLMLALARTTDAREVVRIFAEN
jgi:L-asparaginase